MYLLPLYGVEEVQVRLVRDSSVNNQNLAVDHCSNGQKAEDILEELENLSAVGLDTGRQYCVNSRMVKLLILLRQPCHLKEYLFSLFVTTRCHSIHYSNKA